MGRGQIALINAETRQLHGRRISRSGRFAPPYPNVDVTENMPFTDEEKHFIKILRKEKRYCSRKFIREFPNKNWSRHGWFRPSHQEDWRIWFDCAKVRKWQTTNCKSRRQHRHCRWSGTESGLRRTERRLTVVLDRSVVILVYDAHLFITSLSTIYD